MTNDYSDSGLVTDYRDWQIPFGRRFRALKIWFVLRSYGQTALKELIRSHIRLGEMFAHMIASRRDLFTIIAGPKFALTVVAISLPSSASIHTQVPMSGAKGCDAQSPENLLARNKATRRVYDLIFQRGQLYLTSAEIDGLFVIRVVIAQRLSSEEHTRTAFQILVSTAEEVLADG